MRISHLYLLLTAAYGLVLANAKWQVQSDQSIFDLSLSQSQQIPQLFYLCGNGELVLVVVGIQVDLKEAAEGDRAAQFIKKFNEKFELGTTWSGSGRMKFFGINHEQAEDFTLRKNADDKLSGIVEYHVNPTTQRV